MCKLFFTNTLDISHRIIRTVISKKGKLDGVLVEPDMRGKHQNHSIVDPEITESIEAYINSIPRIKNHFLRAQIEGKFMCGYKSISSIYRDYLTNCEIELRPKVSTSYFRKILRNDFNLSRPNSE